MKVQNGSGAVTVAEKDITEKILESYNDVFADIVNVLLFDGKQIIRPEELEDQAPRSAYKADGKLREMERDVAKRWTKSNIRIACVGLENQTEPDADMPLRVLLRSHRTYGLILRGMFKPNRLRSPQARDAWLERAWANFPEPQRNVMREMERGCFLDLDFPDFFIFAGDTAIRRPDGTAALEGAMRAPLECTAERLGGLTEETLQTALEDLRGIIGTLRAKKKESFD